MTVGSRHGGVKSFPFHILPKHAIEGGHFRAVLEGWRPCLWPVTLFWLFVAGIHGATPAFGEQDLSLSLRLDRNKATIADSVRMVVTVSGTRDGGLAPRVGGTEAFRVSKGGTSSQIRIVNGEVNASMEHSYILEPKRSGRFTLGPAEVSVNGRTLRSNTVTLHVVEDSGRRGAERGPVFLAAELSSGQVYVEQQVVYVLRLYRRIRVSDLSLSIPEVEGLIFKKLGDPTEYETIYAGKRYQVVEVRYRILPAKAGLYHVAPAKIRMTVYEPGGRRRQGFFDDPFFSPFSSGRPMTVAGDPVDLQVSSLPEAGRPAGFGGLVGDFNISAGLTPARLASGDSATFTVVVTGAGNINRIPDLTLPEIDGMKIYADQPVLDIEERDDGLFGSKTMKWALVPNRPGEYEIPPVALPYFDPDRETYDVLKTLSLKLTASLGDEAEVGASPGPSGDGTDPDTRKEEVRTLARDILPIHTSVKVLERGGFWGASPVGSWLILVCPVIVYGVILFWLHVRGRSKRAAQLSRAKRAASVFQKACKRSPEDGAGSSKAVYEAFRRYLNDRFDLALGSVTPREVRDILLARGASSAMAEAAEGLVERLEDAIYGGGVGSWGRRESEQACHIVRQIEKDLK